MLEEDEQERRNFDAVTADLHGGDPLASVQIALTMWARQAPPNGTYGCMLAIFANEVEKARAQLPPNVEVERLRSSPLECGSGVLVDEHGEL